MYRRDLELYRATRQETLRIGASIDQAQSEFAPAPDKWSAGEVLHHLLLAEEYYKKIFDRLVELQRAGQPAIVTAGYKELSSTLAFIPKPLAPLSEIPLTVVNMFLPALFREMLTQFRFLKADTAEVARPTRGLPLAKLLAELEAAGARTAALFDDNRDLNFREMRFRHPLMGNNDAPQLLRMLALHERRHQAQILEVLRSRHFPRAA
jgi:uncharacterized damage-inducible protein DinB